MKIGFFTDSYFPEIDGVTYTIKLWREELERKGHEVYVVYPDGDYEPGDREFPVRSLPNPFYAGYRIPLTRRTSTLPELDVVHCHGPAPIGILGRYYAWKHDLPTIYTHHTPLEEYFHQSIKLESIAGLLSKLYVPGENAFLRSFDVVTASTERIERDVEHVQLPVGIDMDFFQSTEEDWYPDRTVIGYSGRLSMEKTSTKSSGSPRSCRRTTSSSSAKVPIVTPSNGTHRITLNSVISSPRGASDLLLLDRRLRHRLDCRHARPLDARGQRLRDTRCGHRRAAVQPHDRFRQRRALRLRRPRLDG